MVDNTDFRKCGIQTEHIGKGYSPITHTMILGFIVLFLGITDNNAQMLVDNYLIDEKWRKNNYNLK